VKRPITTQASVDQELLRLDPRMNRRGNP